MKTTVKISAIVLTISGAMFLANCNETKQSDKEADQTVVVGSTSDSLEKLFLESMLEINQNLEMIREKEGIIVLGTENPSEENISTKDRIIRNIQMINSLMEKNREKIAELNKQVKQSKTKNAKLEKLASKADETIREYERQLSALKEELITRNFEVADLNVRLSDMEVQNQILKDVIDGYDKETNTAYYAFGNYKELKEHGVLEKKGGFLRMGRTKGLPVDFKEDYFTKIDIREVTTIPLHVKKAKLITNHPSDTYEFKKADNMVAALEIKNPQSFWKTSKYMVVEVK